MPTAAATPTAREPAIDVVKGWAILCVLLIHSDALHNDFFFRNVVNHAVPVFVVLYGINSAFWWRRRPDVRAALGEWYVGRLDRILVPVWAMLPLWWALALYFRPFGVEFTWWLPVVQALGCLLQVGTGWFVTMILQLVLLQPLFEVVRRRWGIGVLLALGVVGSAVPAALAFELVARLGTFGYWTLVPRFFAHVAFGMALAPWIPRLDWRAAAVAGVVFAAAVVASEGWFGPRVAFEGSWVTALALTVILLVVLRPLARVAVVGPAMVWLGQSSYGIYIGQMITHNAFVYAFGLRHLYVRLDLWLYTTILLAGGIGFTVVGEELRRLLDVARARPARVAAA